MSGGENFAGVAITIGGRRASDRSGWDMPVGFYLFSFLFNLRRVQVSCFVGDVPSVKRFGAYDYHRFGCMTDGRELQVLLAVHAQDGEIQCAG